MTPLDERAAELIRRRGPVPFAEVVELALYDDEHGFFSKGGGAGRRGDFITSPEVGPLFGALVGRALDSWWTNAGRPDPFVVVECGAGAGTLARSVLASTPACASALRYVLVERSEALRDAHRSGLPLVAPAHAFAPSIPSADDPDAERPERADGPLVVSLAELPRSADVHVVLANELLDNLPFDLAECRAGKWHEVRVGLDDETGALIEVSVPMDECSWLPASGERVPIQHAAAEWVRNALATVIDGGRLVVFDYASTTAELAARPAGEWLRTYRGHERGGPPLVALGSQDITCEVAIDQLVAPESDRSQADWLASHGIQELVETGRRVWKERAAKGDLEAVRARSRVNEAAALTDPDGLGAFRVLEWER